MSKPTAVITRLAFILPFILFGTACVQLQPLAPSNQPHQPDQSQTNTTELTMELTLDLIAAAEQGDIETVQSLLTQGAAVDAANSRGVTPLIAAAYRNQLAVAKVLIDAGADVNVQDRTQQSAYLISTADGYLALLKLTLANGADVHSLDSYNGTGLIRAADRGHVEIIAELLQTDIDIDHVNRLGWTALLEAVILGDGGPRHTEVVRLLVDAGADINLADSNGVTPLDHARQRSYDAMVTILENH
ncbi:MAG TPA: ankyrin repeat domain-containing protein [Caldilineaceae bacterium]|nr:ankyrin repeat domain-containing protein [Caldilineaceae bacterium]